MHIRMNGESTAKIKGRFSINHERFQERPGLVPVFSPSNKRLTASSVYCADGQIALVFAQPQKSWEDIHRSCFTLKRVKRQSSSQVITQAERWIIILFAISNLIALQLIQRKRNSSCSMVHYTAWNHPKQARNQRGKTGQLPPPPKIFKNIFKAPITFLVVRCNKLQSFCPRPLKISASCGPDPE